MTPTIRPLTADEHRALTAARLVAVEFAPYLAHALFAVRPLAADGLDTFAVDRQWRLYMDPARLTEWGPQTTGAVLVHEINHLVREHAERADALGSGVDHNRWNIATDAAINDDLLRANMPLPEWVVTPANQGLPDAGIEESYYATLAPQPPQTETGCGSGAGDPRQSWEPGLDDPGMPGMDPAQVTITRRRVAQDIRDAATNHRGTVPAGLERWADSELAAPTVPWRKVLAGMVRRVAALTTGRTTYTYSRPGRRRLPSIITPAMRSPKVTIAVVIDTSGSMGEHDLATALAEVNGVVKAVGGRIQVLTCDADASEAKPVRSGRDVRLTGGGGTDMRVGIAAAEKLTPAVDAVVVITDGWTPWPTTRTRAALIVVLTQDGAQANVPAWARTIVVR
jgi:predicted metal-dependent peptidase